MQTLRPAMPPTALLAVLLATLAGCAAAPPAPPRTEAAPAAPAISTAVEAANPAPVADGAAPLERRFAAWIADFQRDARAHGIDAGTLAHAFAEVRYLAQVVERDRAQAEFTRTVWDYLDSAVSPGRIARGQSKMLEVRAQADAAAARYGVPVPILVAIWGMESNYGDNTGSIATIDALATLGFDGRRADWARGELLAALRILQNGDIARERMIGSWAGAMGQTQFLPTNFLAYAVDADGDGRRDLWGSSADVLASTAHLLARAGWRPGQPWGLEVRLPPGFDVGRADTDVRQSSALWAAEGVHSIDGAAPPELPDAAVLLPAGAHGPAFLVGANFRAILRYNNATSYALAVGLLAQQLAGGAGVQAPWPRDLRPLTRSEVLALQAALNRRGFDSGKPDGLIGPATRSGIRAFQRSIGLPADGYATAQLLQRVLQGP